MLRAYRHGRYYEEWIELWKKVTCWDDEHKTAIERILHEHGYVAAVEELLRINEEFGKKGCQMGDRIKVMWYIEACDYNKALTYLEKLYESGYTNLPYMATNMEGYEQLKSYPGYVEILNKMNLPLPKK